MLAVIRRILIHGGLTAFALGILGVAIVELVGVWMMAPVRPGRSALVVEQPDTDELQARVSLMMAGWGFSIVALGEFLLFAFRKKQTQAVLVPAAPDETEKLLEELLAQAEQKTGLRVQTAIGGGASSEGLEAGRRGEMQGVRI